MGSTAVLSTPDRPFIVAVKKAGIYSFKAGEWLLQYSLTQNIYKLIRLGRYIFGIGDNGTIIRYEPYQKKWNHTSFPTPQRLWDITGNSDGLIITHGGSRLYVSTNFGSNWNVIKPFHALSTRPFIRSLFYHKGNVYIGTQVNKESGGLWKYSLQSGEMTHVKKEESSMISSIYIDHNQSLYIARGSSFTRSGSIEILHADKNEWQRFQQPVTERAFLDLFSANEKIFTTSSKDEYGFSRLYEICTKTMTLVPIETVEGHGFRGAGFKDQLFISSPVESKWINPSQTISNLVH